MQTVQKNLNEIIGKPQTRNLSLRSENISVEEDLIEFSISSEEPVKRWFYSEILEHSKKAINLDRFKRGSIPLLFNHNPDLPIGVIEKVWLDPEEKKLRAKARFSKRAFAQEVLSDVRDGIISNISVGYTVDEFEERNQENDNDLTIIAKKWTFFEASIAPVPADHTVGIGRSFDFSESNDMNEPKQTATPTASPPPHPEVSIEEAKRAAAEGERQRISSISALCARHGFTDLAPEFISAGTTIEDTRLRVLDKIAERQTQQPIAANPVNPLGLSNKEEKEYSIVRAVRAHIEKDWSKAGFERECSLEIEKRAGKSPNGFYVPIRDLKVRAPLATTVPAQAGVLIETTLDSASFIDILRNRPLVMQMGARILSNLTGYLTIPKQIGSTVAYWVSEGVGPAETEPAFGSIGLTPKTLGVLSAMTRLMMLQSSPDVEQLTRNDILNVIALEIDRAVINGSGVTGQPRGILNTPGVGTVSLGTNGGLITYDALVDQETQVATANADTGTLSYFTNPKVVGALKKLKDSTNNYLWTPSTTEGLRPGTPGLINGYSVYRTNQMPSSLTKGTGTNLSSLIFGDWSQIIVGEWGILDILPNPYGAGYAAGNIEIRALQTIDVQCRQANSFSVITDIIA